MSDDEDKIVASRNPSDKSAQFEIAGDTFSVDSSITAYRIENNRRYPVYRDYWAPNDDIQAENLDIIHHKYLRLLDGKLHVAPLEKKIERALDLGTGTGIWAIDFADEFPNTTILGTDLSPIQPNMVPQNCQFEIDDAQDYWVYPENYFDFVHIRGLFGSISDWPALYKQAFDHLKPGGWIEHIEYDLHFKSDDDSLPPDNALHTLCNLFIEAGEITGKTFDIANTMRRDIEATGFTNIHEKVYKDPMGPWPSDLRLKEIGKWTLLGFDIGLEGHALSIMTKVMGWNINEVHVLLAQVRQAVRNKDIHAYHDIRITYAQKPT